MYAQTNWKDHVVTPVNRYTKVENPDGTITLTPAGTIVQQGTNMSAVNFNNEEVGIQDVHVAERIAIQHVIQKEGVVDGRLDGLTAECVNEVQTVNFTNTAKYPFNSSLKTVSLQKARKTLNYNVMVEVVSSVGLVGDVYVTDRQLNGFKVAYDGSATAAVLKLRIIGGMLV